MMRLPRTRSPGAARRAILTVLTAWLVATVLATPAQAQVKSCGEGFQLFIRNPDIQPSGDGKFHVTGDVFIQFQVIGDRADDIEVFAFSVGLPVDNPEEICALPIWPAGLMLESYKADLDKTDGFVIYTSSNSDTTPQNLDLSVAVHAYDADGTELARFWGTAIVENCPGGPGPGCSGDPAAIGLDKTMPWPIILPGDGAKSYVDGFTIEFPEPLSHYVVELNGINITDEMEPWEGLTWDRDTFYDYGPAGIFNNGPLAMCGPLTATPLQNCGPTPGPSLQWTRRVLTDDDIVRVIASDLNGNIARKEIHIGSSVAGGTIADGVPILQMTFDESTVTAAPGTTARFHMTMENNGGGEGHPFASAQVPEGWDFEWDPGHKPVPAGGSSEQDLLIKVPENATLGTHKVRAIVDYRQGSADQSLQSALNVLVDLPETAPTTTGPSGDTSEDSPFLGLWLALLAVVILAVRRTRT